MGEGDNMKRSLFKILTIAICIVTMLNIVLPSVSYVVYADDTNTTEAQKEEISIMEDIIMDIIDSSKKGKIYGKIKQVVK